MLSWLAAAAVPLAIHLWNRRKYREVSWAADRISCWPRCERTHGGFRSSSGCCWPFARLIVVLVALAVAEPYLEGARPRFRHRPANAQSPGASTAPTRWPIGRPTKAASNGPSWPPPNRRRKSGRRRLPAGRAGRSAGRRRRLAGPRAERFSGRDRQPPAGPGAGRSAGHARQGRRSARPGRGDRPAPPRGLFSHRSGAQHLGARNWPRPRPKPNIASV